MFQEGFEGRERRGGVDGRLIKDQIKKQLLPPDSDEGVVSDSEDENGDAEDASGQYAPNLIALSVWC